MDSFSRGGNTNTEAVGVKVNFWKVQFDTFCPQKFYPLLTTFVACWRRPTKDKISLLVAFLLWSQADSSCWIRCNLSPDSIFDDLSLLCTCYYSCVLLYLVPHSVYRCILASTPFLFTTTLNSTTCCSIQHQFKCFKLHITRQLQTTTRACALFDFHGSCMPTSFITVGCA